MDRIGELEKKLEKLEKRLRKLEGEGRYPLVSAIGKPLPPEGEPIIPVVIRRGR